MPHPDADDLALLSLDEALGRSIDAHVAECAECSAEVESFRQTVDLAELSNYGENAPRPGEHVWAAIAAELGFANSQLPASAVLTETAESVSDADSGPLLPTVQDDTPDGTNGSPPLPTVDDMPAGSHGSKPHLRAVPGTGSPQARDGAAAASSTSGPRRWSRWAAPMAAAVVGIAVGAGAVVVSQNRSDDVTIEATAPLTPVVGGPLTADQQAQLGKAQLLASPTGQEVRVNAADLPPSNDSYEVWLFGDDGRMVSLGTLAEGSGSFAVPEGISTREYRVVDVSDEPPDGNPLHSGVSLIRGSFS